MNNTKSLPNVGEKMKRFSTLLAAKVLWCISAAREDDGKLMVVTVAAAMNTNAVDEKILTGIRKEAVTVVDEKSTGWKRAKTVAGKEVKTVLEEFVATGAENEDKLGNVEGEESRKKTVEIVAKEKHTILAVEGS